MQIRTFTLWQEQARALALVAPRRMRVAKAGPWLLGACMLVCVAHAQAATVVAYTSDGDFAKLSRIRSTPQSLGPGVNATELEIHVRDNRITVTGGAIAGTVYGAAPFNANTENNLVFIDGGSIGGQVYGTYTGGAAQKNSVAITAGNIAGGVYGGYGMTTASHNTVTIRGKNVQIGDAVIGGNGGVPTGTALNSKALNNSVTVQAGKLTGQVIGGNSARSAGSLASANSVTIGGAQADISGQIIGGRARMAKGNTVTINAGTIKNDVIGGDSSVGTVPATARDIYATHNTITIAGTPVFGQRVLPGSEKAIFPALYGGTGNATGRDFRTGNTLEMRAQGITLRNLHNFETLNFDVRDDTAKGDTVLVLLNDNETTDLRNTHVCARLVGTGKTNLQPGDTITLLHSRSGKIVVSGAGRNAKRRAAASNGAPPQCDFAIAVEGGNKVVATLVSVRPSRAVPATAGEAKQLP